MYFVKSIFVYTVSILIMVSSAGMMLDKHYCMGELKFSSLYTKAPSCHAMTSCHADGEKSCCEKDSEDDGCCDHESDFAQLDLEYTSLDKATQDEIQLKPASSAGQSLAKTLKSDVSVPTNYSHPPPIIFNRQVRFQVFRC